jgi:hypothetical protein
MVAAPKTSFHPVSFQLKRLEESSFLDSIRALPRADSSLTKYLIPHRRLSAADSTTAYYYYRTFPFGLYQAKVVAVITDYNTVSGSLQLLLFTTQKQWVSTVALASHYNEAGATVESSSIQESLVSFRQQKVTTEVLEAGLEEDEPGKFLGVATTNTHTSLKLTSGGLKKTRLDSTYRLLKHR